MAEKRECECGEEATLRVVVTDADGTLLDEVLACRRCAARGLELLGLNPGA